MTAVALGCSHTAGVGIDPKDCYVSVLSSLMNLQIENRGIPGGNADDVVDVLISALKNSPEFVIAQWPNPMRRTVWHSNTPTRENIHNAGSAFQQLLRSSEENFYYFWIRNIVIANALCKMAQVPCINIMIEDVDLQYHHRLAQQNIELHVDRKTPEETWLMDSAAQDGRHHSARCHKQWAERLLRLRNEYTTS